MFNSKFIAQLHQLLLVILVCVLNGCATINQQSEQESIRVNQAFRNGSLLTASNLLDKNFKIENLQEAKKNNQVDTTYFLEKGLYLSLLGPKNLHSSTQSLLVADQLLRDWESQVSLSLRMTPSEFSNTLRDKFYFNRVYLPRDYEKTFINYQIALNHAAARRYDLALVAANQLRDREELIRQALQKELEGSRANVRAQMSNPRNKGYGSSVNTVDKIPNYDMSALNDPEVAALKNAYQNAAAYYLTGFIYEQDNNPSNAAISYKNAAEIAPQVDLFQKSWNEIRKPMVSRDPNMSDVLLVIDTGFLGDVYSFKARIPFFTPSGPKIVSWVIPAIRKNTSFYQPSMVTIGKEPIALTRVLNVQTMASKDLKDRMPGYIASAVASSIVQVVAQEVTARAIDNSAKQNQSRSNQNNQNPYGDIFKAISAVAISEIAAGDVDTRMWRSLPAEVYMARLSLPKGQHQITIPTRFGPRVLGISMVNNYEIIHARIFDNGVVSLQNSNRFLGESEYSISGSVK